MPQIEWPRRYAICGTIANVTNSNTFFVNFEDTNYFKPKDLVNVSASGSTPSNALPLRLDDNGNAGAQVGAAVYLQQGGNDPETEFTLSTDIDGHNPIWRVPAHFHIWKDAGLITNYPQFPQLIYPSAQTLESNYNPHHIRPYVVSNPVYKGSVEIDAAWEDDGILVQTFIDQLAIPGAWFECPLPGHHLGSSEVEGYSSDGIITIEGSVVRQNNHLKGWYARVGNKTCHITEDDTVQLLKSNVEWANDGFIGEDDIGVSIATYNALSDHDRLVFTSIARIDGTPPSDGGPRVGVSYYVHKIGNHQSIDNIRLINLFPNSNLTGTTIKFSQNNAPVSGGGWRENRFVIGGPYENHAIKIVPSYLIDDTFANNDKNNFSATDTIRVRPTSISATGSQAYGTNPFIIEWIETDGST